MRALLKEQGGLTESGALRRCGRKYLFMGGHVVMQVFRRLAIIGGIAMLAFASAASAGTITQAAVNDPSLSQITSDWGISLAQNANLSFTSSAFTSTNSSVAGRNGYNVLYDAGTGQTYSYPSDAADFISHGGALCDIDAVYAQISNGVAYFAAVTNASPYGTPWDSYPSGAKFGPGDLNVTTLGGTSYGIGARPFDNSVSLSGYGQPDQRSAVTWNSSSATVTGGLTTVTGSALVEKGPTWSWVDNSPSVNPAIQAYFVDGSGTPEGTVTASWTEVYPTGYTYPDDSYGGSPQPTWVYQVAVPLADLGLGSDATLLALSSVSFGVDCGNDILGLTPSVGGLPTVPEPVSMIFFATGLIAVGGYMARRRMLGKA